MLLFRYIPNALLKRLLKMCVCSRLKESRLELERLGLEQPLVLKLCVQSRLFSCFLRTHTVSLANSSRAERAAAQLHFISSCSCTPVCAAARLFHSLSLAAISCALASGSLHESEESLACLFISIIACSRPEPSTASLSLSLWFFASFG